MTLFFMISHSLSSYESLFLIHAFGDTKDTETHIILVIIIIKMWHHNKHTQREDEKAWKVRRRTPKQLILVPKEH